MVLIKPRIFSCKELFQYMIFHLCHDLFSEVHIHDLHFSSGPKRVKWLARPPCLWNSRLFRPSALCPTWHLLSEKQQQHWAMVVYFQLLQVSLFFCPYLRAQPAPGGSAEWWQSKSIAGLQTWSSPSYALQLPKVQRGWLTSLWVLLVSRWCWANIKHSLKTVFLFSSLFFFSWSPADTFSRICFCLATRNMIWKKTLPYLVKERDDLQGHACLGVPRPLAKLPVRCFHHTFISVLNPAGNRLLM